MGSGHLGRCAAYVFTRDGAGWSPSALLKALFPHVRGTFGTAVALWRNTLAIGAPHIIGPDVASGEVDIFERSGAGWRTPQVRTAPAPSAPDYFGAQLSLWGDTLVAGINGDSSAATGIDGDPRAPGGPILSGAVQVFDRDGGLWVPETYLKAANPTQEASFCVVAVSGDTVIVGAPGTGGGPDQPIGSFYVFQYQPGHQLVAQAVARRLAEVHGLPRSSVDQIALLVDLRGVTPVAAQRCSATTASCHRKNVVDAERTPLELSCQKQRETGASAVREGNL